MPALDAIIFDVGNVLYHWDIRRLYAPLVDDPARLERLLGDIVTPAWHFQHDAGRNYADTSAELAAEHPEFADLIHLFGPRFGETIGPPVEGMVELARNLHAQGLILYGITNFSHEFWPPFRAGAPVFDLFDNIIVSGDEKLTKPDPAIFDLAKRRFPVAPDRALFIDDQPKNAAAAEAAGYHAHIFEGRLGLEQRLREFGVNV